MSMKSTITDGDNFSFYHKTIFGDEIKEVIIESINPNKCNIGKAKINLTSNEMDKIAIAWIKERKLGSVFGGPVGLEWGSPDCGY